MKKILLILVILFCYGIGFSQRLLHDLGNSHVTTASVTFSSDGRLILTGGYPRFYDVATGNLVFRTIPKDTETQSDFTFESVISPDNRTFAVVKVNRLEIWDFQSRIKLNEFKDNQLLGRAVRYSPDGNKIIYLRKNGDLIFQDLTNYKFSPPVETGIKNPLVMVLDKSGNQVITGTKDGDIVVFDIGKGAVKSITVSAYAIEEIGISSGEEFIAVASADGRIWLGRYPNLEILATWQAHPQGGVAIDFHPSGKYLVSGGKDKMIRVWSVPSAEKAIEWRAHKNPVSAVSFSPSGQVVASGSLNAVFSSGIDDTKIWSFDLASSLSASILPQPGTVKEAEPVQKKEESPFVPTPPPVTDQKKLALVIGNGNYIASVLANPENDARAMKTALEQSGFDVIKYENLNQAQMKKAMDEFGEKLKSYDVGLFFYAGHGIQSKGFNFLIPVDAELKSEQQVEYDCVQADRILGLMEASGTDVNIVILDACRNNPFERSWSRSTDGKGLAYMDAPSGSLIAYATAPGRTASDGSGQNGLYTSAILEFIKVPDISILQMFQNVRNVVSRKSGKQQIPWESTSLTGDFYFYRTGQTNP